MRRVHGIWFESPGGPVHEAFLELGDVTVLCGINDSGKTRVLGLIEAALTELGSWDMLDVYGVATEAEVAAFVDLDTKDRHIERQVADVTEFRDELELPDQGSELPFGVRLPLLPDRQGKAWLYGRSLEDLDSDLQAAITGAAPWAGNADPCQPLKIEGLGEVDPLILPEAIVVPSPPELVEREVAIAVTRLCKALRELGDLWPQLEPDLGPLRGGPPKGWSRRMPSEPFIEGRPSWLWLVDEQPQATVIHPAAIEACEMFVRIAERLLPDFIRSEYALELAPAQPTLIARGNPIALRFARRDTLPTDPEDDDDDDIVRFELADAASGFVVWLQLALREATARTRLHASLLQDCVDQAGRVDGIVVWSEDLVLDEPEPAPGNLDLDEIKPMLEDILEQLSDPKPLAPRVPIAPGREADAGQDTDPEAWMSANVLGALRTRLYLLDEPEQRLHPALARRAARWLAGLMSEWGSQCILATHTIAFIDIPGNTRAYQLTRTADDSILSPLDPAALTPHALLARELGLDRGEFLSRWRAFLFAETPELAALIEELYADRLATSGIRVLALNHPHPDQGQLDITILHELTGAPTAVLLLSAPQAEIDELRDASSTQRATATQNQGPVGTIARLLELEIRQDRHIEILTVQTPDIVDLLDEDALRHTSATTPDLPHFQGHQAARDAYNQTTPPEHDRTYTDFLNRTYGISITADTIRETAGYMRETQLPTPPALDDALWRIDQLALADETN
jgi:AAA domain, putative AbiEii toxin, Type IV TA system